MFLQAKIKCDKGNTPYRIYINDDLVTERYYTAVRHLDTKDRILESWNTLNQEIEECKDYKVVIENVPGYPKAKTWIEQVHWQKEKYNED